MSASANILQAVVTVVLLLHLFVLDRRVSNLEDENDQDRRDDLYRSTALLERIERLEARR